MLRRRGDKPLAQIEERSVDESRLRLLFMRWGWMTLLAGWPGVAMSVSRGRQSRGPGYMGRVGGGLSPSVDAIVRDRGCQSECSGTARWSGGGE